MSEAVTGAGIRSHQEQSETEGENNEIPARTMITKVYPTEEPARLEIPSSRNNGKIASIELEEFSNRPRSFYRRNFKKVLLTIALLSLCPIAVSLYYLLFSSRAQLIYTNTIWRHGDRGPTYKFPNFTEKYMIAFPHGIGNLTMMGAEQAEHLGKLLQRRYIHSGNIQPDDIYIRSTDFRRTIETAESVLKGMSFGGAQVHTELPRNIDTAGNPFFDCKVASQLVLDLNESYFLLENFDKVYELMRQNLNYHGYAYVLFDTLICLKAHDLVLPPWLDGEELYENLKFLSWKGIEAQFGFAAYKNELLKKIRTFYKKQERSPSFQHDITIVALLSTFDDIHAILGEIPSLGYGANIAFEIWLIDHSYKMKVLYANQWDDNPRDITKFAPGCEHSSEYCDVTKFIEQSRLLFYDDVQEKCQNSAGNSSSHVVRKSIKLTDASEVFNLLELY